MQGKRKPNTIRLRMMLSYLVITVIGFGIVFFWVTYIVQNLLMQQRVDEQELQIYRIADKLTSPYISSDGETLYRAALDSVDSEHRLLILDKNAVVQVDTSNAMLGERVPHEAVYNVLVAGKFYDFSLQSYARELDPDANWLSKTWAKIWAPEDWAIYTVRAIENNGETVGAVLSSSLFHDVMIEMDMLRAQMALTLVLILLAMMVGSFLISRTITEPIVELTQIIRRMGRGEFNLRVKVTGKGELAELGTTFNDMSERLENTERFRSEFVSNASHEIKTPLATMKILIESLLYQDKFDENVTREFLTDVNKEIDRLNIVISDLLHLVQVDKREGELRREQRDIKEICEEVLHRLKAIAEKRNITLESDLHSALMNIDPIKMHQAIFNLTDNAIKYSDDNSTVKVSCAREDKEAVIRVSDNGIGIPKKDQQHIFDRFYRVDKARSRQTGGTGLGLSIVDGVIKLHGGRIDLESVEGAGSTFIVRLPIDNKAKSERGALHGKE